MDESGIDAHVTTFGRLLEATHRLEQRLGAELERSTGMPLTTFEVLLRLSRSPDERLTMGELSRQLALTTGGITRLVDRLAADGHVVRHRSPHDRRVQYAVLTPAGRDALVPALASHAAALDVVFAGFDRRELATLDAVLDRLRGTAS